MKIIYDDDQPKERRIEFIDDEGKTYFDFHHFQIKLYSEKEVKKVYIKGNKNMHLLILKNLNGGAA